MEYLVDHVTLWVPVLVLTVAVDFDKLLQNRGPASSTLDRVTQRVVVVAKDLAVVLIVRVLGAKYRWTDGTSEVLDVVLVVERRDIAST